MTKWKYDVDYYKLKDKQTNIHDMIDYKLDQCIKIFRWKGLPKTIPARSLELFAQCGGNLVVSDKYDGENLYIYQGGLGGEPDQLYRPTIYTVANPYQRFDKQLTIDWDGTDEERDCVILLNDTMLRGLLPIHRKYATMVAENELSLQLSGILARVPWALSAEDEATKASAEAFIQGIYTGDMSVITDGVFLEGVKEHALTNQGTKSISELIQGNQYLNSQWYNLIGLNSMANGTKKEAISESEEHMNDDVLKPLIDDMLECRQDFCDRVNKRYGTDWSVELNSSWRDNETEEKVAQVEEIGEVLEVIDPKTTAPAEETPEETQETTQEAEEAKEPEETPAEPEEKEDKSPEQLKEEFKELVEAIDEMANEEEEEEKPDEETDKEDK